MCGTAFSIASASSAGKSSQEVDWPSRWGNHLRCFEISPRAVTAESRTQNLLSLSITITCGTTPLIALISSAEKKESRGGPDCRWLNYLRCFEISLRTVRAEWRIHESLSLSISTTTHGTTLSISLTSSARRKNQKVSWTMQITLTQLGKFTEGSHSRRVIL